MTDNPPVKKISIYKLGRAGIGLMENLKEVECQKRLAAQRAEFKKKVMKIPDDITWSDGMIHADRLRELLAAIFDE